MGYNFITKEENITLREGKKKEVLLRSILHESLSRINSYEYKGVQYKFSEKDIEQGIKKIDVDLRTGLLKTNEEITDYLHFGTTIEQELPDKSKKSFSFKFIDWDNIENNSFHFTEEYEIEKQDIFTKEKHKRPDIVVFINGIPLGIIELKRSSVEVSEGVSQNIRNQKEGNIPHLFKYIQLAMAGNTTEFRYGTVGTPLKFWALWTEEDESFKDSLEEILEGNLSTELSKNIYSLLKKDRFLELIQRYTLFDGNVKKVARYQQYFAIKNTLKKVSKINKEGSREGGLIWHTQGSGKSLTMVMLAKNIAKIHYNAKIIIVTDRKALDKQIKNTLKATDTKVEKAESGKHLCKLLKTSSSAVVTTVINKFESVSSENIQIDTPDVFIMIDESHRTQYGALNVKMKRTFPKGCFIGLTGTPLMKKEKNSINKFGGMIHKYTIDKAVKDKSVLPLLYEGRRVELDVSNESALDKRFEILSKGLNEEQIEDLKRKWSRFKSIASGESRLFDIAIDISEHYKNNWQGTGFKGILATSSKYEAVKYHEIFQVIKEVSTAFIISPPDDREGNEEVKDDNRSLVKREWKKIIDRYSSGEDYEERIQDEFIEDSNGVEILIVVDKLLTGFDAPRAGILYLDKELKDHTLLQAIARVNRLYEGKDYGYIIDYRGLLGNLDKALTTYSVFENYDEEDVAHALVNVKEEINNVKSYYSTLQDHFNNIKNKGDREEYERYLDDDKLRNKFYELLKNFSKSLKIALSTESFYEYPECDIKKYKEALKFYNDLRATIRIRYHEAIDFGKFENEMQKMLDKYIDSKGIHSLSKIVNIFDAEFEKEVERLEGKASRADAIRTAITKTISEKYSENPALYDPISKKIRETLEKYKNKLITEEEYLESMKSALKSIKSNSSSSENKYPRSIANNKNAIRIFDNLEMLIGEKIKEYGFYSIDSSIRSSDLEIQDDSLNEEKNILLQLAIKFEQIFKENCKIDWQTNTEINKRLASDLQDILWNLEDGYTGLTINHDEIIEKLILVAQGMY